MKTYRLFNEWRGVSIIGESLGDALQRNGLREADIYSAGKKVRGGDRQKITRVICAERACTDRRRGSYDIVASIVELEDSRIVEVDAQVIKEIIPDAPTEPVAAITEPSAQED